MCQQGNNKGIAEGLISLDMMETILSQKLRKCLRILLSLRPLK